MTVAPTTTAPARTAPPATPAPPPPTELVAPPPFAPRFYRWTRDQYYQLARAEVLSEDSRIELIDGTIVAIPPLDPKHATTIQRLQIWLATHLPDDLHVRCQFPFSASDDSDPEPDLALVAGTFDDYETEHPRTAALIIEVSHTSLAFDRTTKAHVYAAASVPQYWVADVNARTLEVFTQPVPDATAYLGHRYAQTRLYLPDQSIELTEPFSLSFKPQNLLGAVSGSNDEIRISNDE